MGIRNLWTLNVDELLVADKIKEHFSKSEYEVFFPLNSQMKDIDLLLVNVKTAESQTLQVKGSRTYTPRPSEVKKFGNGSAAWFTINSNSIFKPSNRVDYFIFVLHSFVDGSQKKEIIVNFLIVPIDDFQNVCKQKNLRSDCVSYDFYFWVDPEGKRAFEMRGRAENSIAMSQYLNNWDVLK